MRCAVLIGSQIVVSAVTAVAVSMVMFHLRHGTPYSKLWHWTLQAFGF